MPDTAPNTAPDTAPKTVTRHHCVSSLTLLTSLLSFRSITRKTRSKNSPVESAKTYRKECSSKSSSSTTEVMMIHGPSRKHWRIFINKSAAFDFAVTAAKQLACKLDSMRLVETSSLRWMLIFKTILRKSLASSPSWMRGTILSAVGRKYATIHGTKCCQVASSTACSATSVT